jgi:FkbM family methyltransferase
MSEEFLVNKINKFEYSNGIAFDIGANIGDYSLILAQKFSTVYAFEPHPVNVKIITDRQKPPELASKIILEEMAISNFTGKCKLYTQPDTLLTGHSISEKTIVHPNWQLDKKRFLEVPCMTIDDFCKEKGIIPTFIKMDIEGGEDTAWEGAIKTLKENDITIGLEIHLGVNVEKLTKLFNDLGYKIEGDIPSSWLSRHVIIDKQH